MALVQSVKMWMLQNPGIVWSTAILGGIVAWQAYNFVRPRKAGPSQEQIRRMQVERMEREKVALEQSTRRFFFDGDLTEALQLFAHQLAILLVVIEHRGSSIVTPLSTVWANSTVQDLVCQFPTQPSEVIAIHLDPDSVEGKFFTRMFNQPRVPTVLALGGTQNLVLPAGVLNPAILVEVIMKLKDQMMASPEQSMQHKDKGEWMIQQLLLANGTLNPDDFAPDSDSGHLPPPGREEFTATSLSQLPAVEDTDTPESRAYLQAQQNYEYEQGLVADQQREAERNAAAAKAAHEQDEADLARAMALSLEAETLHVKANTRAEKRARLLNEPAVGEMPGIATVVFRFGSKDPVTRRFRPLETLQDLKDFLFVECEIEECRLMVMGMTNEQMSNMSLTMEAARFAPKTQVIVECDQDSDEE